MKKSLLALAVLGAFAGAASAQTNVTIYGVADIGITRTDTSATSATWALSSGNQSGSRLGFKGTEDLGGGLSAIFTLENGFSLDTGALGSANTLFNRQAFVGLAGGFGAVKFGRQYTPTFLALDSVDPFGTGLAGAISNVFTGGGNGDIRMSNTINYTAPAMGGFSAQAAYGLGEVAGDNGASRQIGLGAGYANGPINVQFAYHDTNNATDTDDATTTLLGGSFDFRVAKLHAAFAVNKGFAAVDTRDAMIGVSAPVGAGSVMVSYIRQDDKSVAAADLSQAAVGYVHNLSKRTNLYTSYGRTSRDVGADSTLFNVGIRHKF